MQSYSSFPFDSEIYHPRMTSIASDWSTLGGSCHGREIRRRVYKQSQLCSLDTSPIFATLTAPPCNLYTTCIKLRGIHKVHRLPGVCSNQHQSNYWKLPTLTNIAMHWGTFRLMQIALLTWTWWIRWRFARFVWNKRRTSYNNYRIRSAT